MEDIKCQVTLPLKTQLTEPDLSWELDDGLINGVVTAAVWSEGQRPGTWQMMIKALKNGADKTTEGTVEAFLFRAMVDRLREEFRALDSE